MAVTDRAENRHQRGRRASAPGARLRLSRVNVVYRPTHWHNRRSRAAIERPGAEQDGVLRSHFIVNGIVQDTVSCSILATTLDRLGSRAGKGERMTR